MTIKNSQTVSLMAPVPSFHLDSGLETLQEEGGVLFASNAFSVFHQLESTRKGQSVTVWIYESHQNSKAVIKWKGTYVGYVSSDDRGQMKLMKRLRPKSTKNDGHTAVYWQLNQLEKLEEPISVTKSFGFRNRKSFKSNYIPQGPTIIEPYGG